MISQRVITKMSTTTGQPRKRNAEATRQKIIEAAKIIFTDKGFDRAATREIADLAGVNVALINRYFGSKAGLFADAILPGLAFSEDEYGGRDDLAANLTALLINKPEEIGFDPIIAMLRSANSDEVGLMLQDALDQTVIRPASETMNSADGREIATILMSIISGYDVLVRLMRLRPHTDPDRRALEKRLKAVFDAALSTID